MDQIAPRLRGTVPHVVRPTGSEDAEELLQDAMALAAQMLHALEARSNEVTVGNICYYVTLLMKNGRRSQSANRTDVLSPGAMLDGIEQCAQSGRTGRPVFRNRRNRGLGRPAGRDARGPASAAARNLDWAEFLDGHDDRYTAMVRCVVSGQPTNSLKRKLRVSDSTLSTFKRKLAADIRETMGTDVLEAVCRRPGWQADVEAEQERMRCRHERQRCVG